MHVLQAKRPDLFAECESVEQVSNDLRAMLASIQGLDISTHHKENQSAWATYQALERASQIESARAALVGPAGQDSTD